MIAELHSEVCAWLVERRRVAELEDDPLGPPEPEAWHDSDDHAARIVHDVAPVVEAMTALAAMDHQVWWDIGPTLTCSEADSLAVLLDLIDPGAGAVLLDGHETGDDGGDSHYVGNVVCTTCGGRRDSAPQGCEVVDLPGGGHQHTDHVWTIADDDELVVEYRRLYGDQAELAAIPAWETVTNAYEVDGDLEGLWRSAHRVLNPGEQRQPCGHDGTTIVLVDAERELWLHTEGPGCFMHGVVEPADGEGATDA